MISTAIDKRVSVLAAAFKREMMQLYGDKLVNVLVYQTVEPDFGGDIFVANMIVVLREMDSRWAEIERTGYAASRLELEQDGQVCLEREFFLESDWEACRHRYTEPPSSFRAISA